jgi:photosystem II stability/assembly factor-like uncharacterized protein
MKFQIVLNFKKKISAHFILFFFLLLTFSTEKSISQWFWQNPFPQGNHLKSISFPSPNTGYIAGFYGTVLKTTNAGNNWNIVKTGTTANLSAAFFINNNTGFVSGVSPVDSVLIPILKTTNGGNSWDYSFIDMNNEIFAFHFINDNVGFMLGNSIYKTTDQGVTWYITGFQIIGKSICFTSNDTGYVAGMDGIYFNNGVYKTTDGGESWNYLPGTNPVSKFVKFISPDTGFVFGGIGNILKTTNGGINWMQKNSGSIGTIYTAVFLNSNTGFAFGDEGKILKTTNNGENWLLQSFENGLYTASSVFISPNKIFFAGYGGGIYSSTNEGNTWSPFSNNYTPKEANSVYFLNSNSGIVAGSNGLIMRTTNAGNTWNTIETNRITNFSCMHFPDLNTGYIIGWDSAFSLMKSTNGGANWFNLNNHEGGMYDDIFFVNSNTGFVLKRFWNPLSKTTDGGNNWTVDLSIQQNGNYKKIYFINENTGFISGLGMLMTTNCGITWDTVLNSAYNNLNEIYFINSNTGFVTRNSNNIPDSSIFKTTNAGINWFGIISNFYNLRSIQFINENTGFAVAGSAVLKTTNGGYQWFAESINSPFNCNDLFFTSGNEGYVVGNYGMILKTTNGGVGFNTISEVFPQYFSLSQNYPNPFNSATKIRFSIKYSDSHVRNSIVTLKVYDLLGREITTLVNQELNPGIYETTFDGSYLTSGIYFYNIKVGNYSETKKLVLIK